jgi:heptosyltransferase-1
MPCNTGAVTKAMVVALGKIGDLVLVTPILRALRRLEHVPEVHFLAGTHNHHVLARHPGIDRLHVYPDRPLATLPLMRQLCRERYDLWIDPKDHHSYTGRLLVCAARPARSVGYNGNQRGGAGGIGYFTHGVPRHLENGERHATERALAALVAAGLPAMDPRPWLVASPESDHRFADFRRRHRISRYALVNISAHRPERRWRIDRWIALLQGAELRDLPIVVCALPADGMDTRRLAASRNRVFHYRTRSAADLLPVVRDATLLVTVDTGVVHIASAFDTPIVALYANGSVQFRKYRPLSRCSRPVIGSGANNLVTDISVETVEAAVCSLRSEIANHRGTADLRRAMPRTGVTSTPSD